MHCWDSSSSYVTIIAFSKQSYHKGSEHGYNMSGLTTHFKGKETSNNLFRQAWNVFIYKENVSSPYMQIVEIRTF